MSLRRPTTWWLAIVLLALALGAATLDRPPVALALAAAAWALAATRALRGALARRPPGRPLARAAWSLVGAAAVVALPLSLLLPLDALGRAALAALAAQALLAALGSEPFGDERRWARRLLPLGGHAAMLSGGWVMLAHGEHAAHIAVLAYASGFGVLALHAHWTQRMQAQDDDARRQAAWEPALLGGLLLLVAGGTGHYLALAGLPEPYAGALGALALALAAAAAGSLVLVLAGPPPAPRALARAEGGTSVPRALAHSAATLALLNVAFVVLSVVATWGARLTVAALTVFVVFAVLMEYRALRDSIRARRALRLDAEPEPCREEVTVVVSALGEAALLRESLPRNLALPETFRFLLVASTRSQDDTVAVCERFAREHPDRVAVLAADGGSKAADLNLAWRHIRTDLVLMLDADELVDEAAVRHGLARMRADPSLAVVQGRKVSQDAEGTPLARFVSTERRHSTLLDQLMHGNLGSAHFAGSAALLRKRAVEDAGGWTEETMTEDIEFTLRLHLRTGWRITYEPRMVVLEADPETAEQLVRQRTRWARGWMQCFTAYFDEIPRRRARLGSRRTAGLMWLLFTAVSAPLMAILPAMVLMRAMGIPSLLPYAIGVAVACFVLPARLVGYTYAALTDPVIPVPRTPRRLAELVGHAYAWILFGWVVHFHALYLELSSAPRVWYVTRKRGSGAPAATPTRKGVTA